MATRPKPNPVWDQDDVVNPEFAPIITRLQKDILAQARDMTPAEVRKLVRQFYQVQRSRIRAGNQRFALLAENPEASANMLQFAQDMQQVVENNIARVLKEYCKVLGPLADWCLSIHGMGPLLTTGFCTEIDIAKSKYAGHLWSFAGLNPKMVWNKGQKRPYNAVLKTLCWKWASVQWRLGSSEKSYYGPLMFARKDYEVKNNENLVYKDQAEETLKTRKIEDPATKAMYESGKLPAGRIQLRAMRWGERLFLSHFYEVARECAGLEVSPPYILMPGKGHTDYIPPPGWVSKLKKGG